MSDNQPEQLSEPYAGGNKEVGEALRRFFLSLLDGTNLRDYHQNRNTYIDRNVSNGDAAGLLKSDALIEIEKHILAIDGSTRAKPIWVVSPPY